jgi:translation initiation factor IF-2
MTETTKNTGEKLSVTSTKTLTLKRGGVEQGVVRQSFSHGRSKAVVVEKVKRRIASPGEKPDGGTVTVAKRLTPTNKPLAREETPPKTTETPPKQPGVVLRPLTQAEIDARASALDKAEQVEVQEREAAKQRAEIVRVQREAEQKERAEAAARKALEEQRHAREESTKKRADELAQKRLGAEVTIGKQGARVNEAEEESEAPRTRRPGGAPVRAPAQPRPQRGAGGEKRRRQLTVVTALAADEVREHSKAAFVRRTKRQMGLRDAEPKEKIIREVTIPETITIQELANRMAERSVDVVRLLMKQGHMAKSTDTIDADTAQLIAEELGHTVRRVSEADIEEGMFDVADDPDKLQPRAPVVTIMGHVDHGKTSLLDAIRSTEVAAGEAGGITQHIGAYQVTSPSGGRITFIDTPGHAAFTAMRARGAKVTDIVVLVVAADDGVMPQTVEAIQHAKAAKVPIIVAVNKIDKPDARPERVRTDLLQHEIQVESLGGDVLEVEVSAKEKLNLDKLLEVIALQAEILQLKANPNRPAEGTVIEARLDRGRGPVATVLVQRGTLKPGDIVLAGSEWGRVRALMSDTGHSVVAAGPSMPVEVLGFGGTPEAGDRLAVVDSEARAREITAYRERQKREKMAARQTGMRGSLEQMMNQLKTAGRKEFPLVIKGDVQGSVEAITGALEKLSTNEVVARVIYSGVGAITESDVTLAEASGAAIIGFNVRAHKEAREAADQAGIEIRYYDIIYNLVDDVKKAMSGMLAPTLRETKLGDALILEIFKVSKVGNVAGCRVTEGVVERGANVRLIRDNVVVHQGKLSQLKRFKDDAREVIAGQECGMAFENYQDMKVGDTIECYRVETVQRTL